MKDNLDEVDRLDILIDERFELLSAYLDGEVTPSERQQVEVWLAIDADFQQQYRSLQKMHQGFRAISVPSSTQSIDALTDAVFAKLDRQRQRKITWLSGGAIAATLVTAIAGVGGLFGGDATNPALQFANNDPTKVPAPMMVALNDPIMSIPTKGEGQIDVPMAIPEVNVDEVN
jgi:anti-sigma factor RsiW